MLGSYGVVPRTQFPRILLNPMSHADCSAVQTVARWLVTSQNIRDFAQSRRGLSKRNETPRIVIKMDFLHKLKLPNLAFL